MPLGGTSALGRPEEATTHVLVAPAFLPRTPKIEHLALHKLDAPNVFWFPDFRSDFRSKWFSPRSMLLALPFLQQRVVRVTTG